jgi:hypothetical protein
VAADFNGLAPAEADPVGALVDVGGAVGGAAAVDPLDGDGGVPGPAADGDVEDLELDLRDQAVEATQPLFEGGAGVALAAEGVVAGEDVWTSSARSAVTALTSPRLSASKMPRALRLTIAR